MCSSSSKGCDPGSSVGLGGILLDRVLPLFASVWFFGTTLGIYADAQNPTLNHSFSREIAITFDDLPVISSTIRDVAGHRQITTRLLESIRSNRVPAIGFVNEDKLLSGGKRDAAQVALLQMWLDAGLELGNHTFSHLDLHTTPLPAYQEDVIRGESATSRLLRNKGAKLRYFRHPYLHTGRDIETKEKLEEFLARRGYRVAPVTMSNSDWIFSAAYERALENGDTPLQKRIVEAYIPYTERIVEYFEEQSIDLLGYEPKQVLLLHANLLNADCFDNLAQMIRNRGYTFVTLDRALQDQAYQSLDTYTGPGGISWLHRWVITKGHKSKVFPEELIITESLMKQNAQRSQGLLVRFRNVIGKFGSLHILVVAILLLLLPLLYFQSTHAFRLRKRKHVG